MLGPLPGSYRWWLADYGEDTVDGADIATVLPSAHVGAVEDVTGRRDGDRLYFYDEGDDGDSQRHVRSAPVRAAVDARRRRQRGQRPVHAPPHGTGNG